MIIRKMLCLYSLKRKNRLDCLGIDKNIILKWTLRNVLEAGLGPAERS
jgi:hypothetical protein